MLVITAPGAGHDRKMVDESLVDGVPNTLAHLQNSARVNRPQRAHVIHHLRCKLCSTSMLTLHSSRTAQAHPAG